MSFKDRGASLVDRFISRYGRLPTEKDHDYLEMLRMSKYRIVNVPDKKEAKCANCGASKNDGRQYIDCNLDIDWYGTVFFCGLCLRELSQAMGLFAELQEEISALVLRIEQNTKLLEVGERLDESVKHMVLELKEFYNALHPSGLHTTGVGRSSDSSLTLVSSNSNSGGGTTRDNPDSDKAKPRIAKSTPSPRRENIRSLAELLDDTDG